MDVFLTGRSSHRLKISVALIALIISTATVAQEAAAPIPLIDQLPFDRVTLNEANDNLAIDVQLLDFPNRQVPSPLPQGGSLELRRLTDPSVLYEISWADIASISTYEQLVLSEAEQLMSDNKADEAYSDLQFLHKNYPQLAGLQQATEQYLQRDAMASFAEKRYDESLAILSALYEINPQRRGLAKAIEGVSDQLIAHLLANRDFRSARDLLDGLAKDYSELGLANLATWQEKFNTGAQRQLEVARQAITSGNYSLARQSAQRAITILPEIQGATEIFDELARLSPQMVVGVAQQAFGKGTESLAVWPEERAGRLTNPRFVELVNVGPEGGEYSSAWADIKTDTSGQKMTVKFNSHALQSGVNAGSLALQLLRMADVKDAEYRDDFAQVFARVEILAGQEVVIHFRRPHVKPIAFLRIPLAALGSKTIEFSKENLSDPADAVKYDLVNAGGKSIQVIVEQEFVSDEEALAALGKGDVDVLDQVPPWHLQQAAQLPDVSVSSYRLPTVHVLLCNYDNPLMRRREFRRALCYGIDRPRMVTEVLGAKEEQSAFRVLSGPIPAGITFNDAIGYAYRQDLQPLPYEPRLAIVLATSARTTVVKRQAELNGEASDKESAEEPELPKPEPLVLLHPRDSVARTTCQLMKRQLDAIGIPVELLEENGKSIEKWDLKYAELCLWEPIVDVRSLLGPDGIAGTCSPTMNLLLNELDRADNWNDVTSQLHRIHQAAFDELPVIPLWQTLNSFAQRKSLAGLSRSSVSLYQDVSQWRVDYVPGGSAP